IAAVARTPIQLGENWWGQHDLEKSTAAGASDHAMFNVMRIGGVTGWLRAATIAAEAGLPVSSHAFPEFSVHLLAVTPGCHMLEYAGHAGDVLREPLLVENGLAYPGAGLDWNDRVPYAPAPAPPRPSPAAKRAAPFCATPCSASPLMASRARPCSNGMPIPSMAAKRSA